PVVAAAPERKEAQLALAQCLHRLHRLPEAEAGYRRALTVDRSFVAAWQGLGGVFRDAGRHDLAEAAFREALALEPNSAASIGNLGRLLLDLGRVDEAIGCFDAARTIDSEHPSHEAHLLFALNYHPDLPAAAITRRYDDWGRRIAARLPAATDWDVGRDP